MKTQLESILAKANKLEDKFSAKSWDDCKTHTESCKLSRDKDNSRRLRQQLETALELLLSLDKNN